MNASPAKKPPLISRFRTIKGIFQLIKNPIPLMDEYIADVGDTFSMYMGAVTKSIMTANPHIIQHVLQKNQRNFRKSEIQVDQLAHFIGKGLLTSEGPYWLKQRRLIQPGFHRAKLAGLVDIMLAEVDLFLDDFDAKVDRGQPIDIAHEMMEMAFIIVAKSLFSTGMEKRFLNELSTNITQIQSFIVQQIRQPFLIPWFKFSGKLKATEEMAKHSKSIIIDIILQRRKNPQQTDDLLDMLLQTRYEDTGEGMTDQQLLEECLIIFVAGHETSANALAWTWYLLGQHPEAVEKIRAEIKTVLGDRKPTFQDLPQLEYMYRVIQESMRLYPPAWITDRVAIENDQADGIELTKDQIIGIYIYGVHHSAKYWPDPEKFDPSRFTKDKIKSRPSYAYMPFGGGPRMCIGNNFAMMEMQLIITRMIQRYDFELIPNQEIELLPMITLRPKNGIMINAARRKFTAKNMH